MWVTKTDEDDVHVAFWKVGDVGGSFDCVTDTCVGVYVAESARVNLEWAVSTEDVHRSDGSGQWTTED